MAKIGKFDKINKFKQEQALSGSAVKFCSMFEKKVATILESKKLNYEYESIKIPYVLECIYNPDFVLKDYCILIETKGDFPSTDRRKMKKIKTMYPDLRIILVFTNSNARIGKKSHTTYGQWCKSNGIEYTDSSIPDSMFVEPTDAQRKDFERMMKEINVMVDDEDD